MKQQSWFYYAQLITQPPILSGRKQPIVTEYCDVTDQHPFKILGRAFESGQVMVLKYYKEISNDELDLYRGIMKKINKSQEAQNGEVKETESEGKAGESDRPETGQEHGIRGIKN